MSYREAFENKVKLDKGVYWCDSANCYMRDAGGGFTVSDRTANDKWEGWQAATKQAKPTEGGVPEGHVIAPIEPTDDMVYANNPDQAPSEARESRQIIKAALNLLATQQPKD